MACKLWTISAIAIALCFGPAFAATEQYPGPPPAQQALLSSLHPKAGKIRLEAAKVSLDLGAGYQFYDAGDAKRILVEGWGNPPSAVEGVLGIVFPVGETYLDEGATGAVVTFEETGFVTDDDAAQSDYDKLITEMKAGEDEENAARKKAEFLPVHLIGWAQAPTYDPSTHNLIWARRLHFGDTPSDADDTLNYDVRKLGRYGVLSLNIVSAMPHLAEVRTSAPALVATAEFDPGARYSDHQSGDKAAGFGLVGLVAAGAGLVVAKKLGALALMALFAKKGIVVIGIAFMAALNWIRRLLGVKVPKVAAPDAESTNPTESEVPPTSEQVTPTTAPPSTD